MKILAIDPGYDRLGVAVIESGDRKDTITFSTCIQTDKGQAFADRLYFVGHKVESIIKTETPDMMALESLFFSKNQTTGLHVAEIRGMLMYIARAAKLKVLEFTPVEIKIAVAGYGKADKRQIIKMLEMSLVLPKRKRLDDEYDAIALAVTAKASVRHPGYSQLS